MRFSLIAMFFVLGLGAAYCQKYPENRHIRAGNRAYAGERWQVAEGEYRRALELRPDSREAGYDLGNSLYRQGRWDEAAAAFTDVGAAYNLGNTLFKQQKLSEALEAYKAAMRANPGDMDAKFNYAYVKKLLENNKEGGQQPPPESEQPQPEPESRQEPRPERQQGDAGSGISHQDATQMLDAMQAQEERTQEKLNERRRAAGVRRAAKNW